MDRDEVMRLLGVYRHVLAAHHVATLSLFGSIARGEARPGSDVDLLVEFSRPVGLFEFIDLKLLLEGILGRPVDLGTPDSLRPEVRERVLAEAIRAA